MAIRFIILFFEGAFVKLLKAECAHKVLRVKFTMHGCNASASDGFLTAVTQSATSRMVVHLTVRPTIMLKETSSRKSLMTFLQRGEDQILTSNNFPAEFSAS